MTPFSLLARGLLSQRDDAREVDGRRFAAVEE